MTDTPSVTRSETGSSSRTDPDFCVFGKMHWLIAMAEEERVKQIEAILKEIAFKGTIQQIRTLVNDPKWDDKP